MTVPTLALVRLELEEWADRQSEPIACQARVLAGNLEILELDDTPALRRFIVDRVAALERMVWP